MMDTNKTPGTMMERIDSKLRELVERNLAPDEAVQVVISGPFKAVVVGTDRRAMVAKRGFMNGATFGGKFSSWDYSTITGVQLDSHMSTGVLIIRAAGEEPIKASYWATGKGSAKEAPNAIVFSGKPTQQMQDDVATLRNLISGSRNGGHVAAPVSDAAEAMDQLKHLGELRDTGVLTAEEFDTKKAALLARI